MLPTDWCFILHLDIGSTKLSINLLKKTRFSICNTKVSVAYIRIATLKLAWLTLELLMNQELHYTCVSMQILTNMSQLADHDSYGPGHLLKSKINIISVFSKKF